MKVLVTGGAGFIGSNIVKRLVEMGHTPAVFDDLSSGYRQNLVPGVPFVEADVRDVKAVAQARRGVRSFCISQPAWVTSVRLTILSLTPRLTFWAPSMCSRQPGRMGSTGWFFLLGRHLRRVEDVANRRGSPARPRFALRREQTGGREDVPGL